MPILQGSAILPLAGEDPNMLASAYKGVPVVVPRHHHVEVLVGLDDPLPRAKRNAVFEAWRRIDDETRGFCKSRCTWHRSPCDTRIVRGRVLYVCSATLRREGLHQYLNVVARLLGAGVAHAPRNYHLN